MEVSGGETSLVPSDQRRRNLLKVALGVSAGVSVLSAGGIARAGTAQHPIGWVHGNSATVLGAKGLEMDVVQGNVRIVRGRSWSTIPLHYAIPSPWLDGRVPMRVSAIWVRLQASAGATLAALSLYDCETTVARLDNLAVNHAEWSDVRIALDAPREVMRSIGVTLDCEFTDVDRQIGISAVGCEFSSLT